MRVKIKDRDNKYIIKKLLKVEINNYIVLFIMKLILIDRKYLYLINFM